MYLPEGYEPSKRATIFWSIFLAVGLGLAIYFGLKRRLALSGEVRYTIGHTIKFQLTTSGRDVKYSYIVNGKRYEDVATYAYNSQVPGGRYLVKFSKKHPEISELYQNRRIPLRIKKAPPEGWENWPP
ncbi:MAG: hypothetical protein M9954_13775 [Cyclobacteriaceae bacterium]|jgi:hypothetical protein|nr:hypothetical protein [Flammeovirgaceae bacterium]MCO5272722.1 hypothetical protein [Cyclobacteriaceae bacterium]